MPQTVVIGSLNYAIDVWFSSLVENNPFNKFHKLRDLLFMGNCL